MVKKGEYLEYAIELEKRTRDLNLLIPPKVNEICVNTEMSIILEMAKKVKELEEKILEMDLKIKDLEKEVKK